MSVERLPQALDILGREERSNRRAYKFLRGAFFGFLGFLACSLLLGMGIGIGPTTSGSLELLEVLLLLTAFAFGVALCFAFLWDLLFMWRNWRFERKFSAISPTGREEDGATPVTWLGRLLWAAIAVLVAPVGAMLLYVATTLGALGIVDTGGRMSALVLGASGLLLLLAAFRSRRRALLGKLQDVNRLRRVLSDAATRSGTEPVDIPAENLNEVARMEKAQIKHDRVEAIASGRREKDPHDYSVLRSREMRDNAARLNAQTRIGIEEQAEMLRRARKPSGAIWDEASKSWRLPVPDTDVEITYVVDDESRTITLLSAISGRREPALGSSNGETDA